MNNFIVDELQKEFDQMVAFFLFENTIAFKAARFDSHKNMERIMNLAARSRKMLRLPGYRYLRTKALPTEYKVVDHDLDKIRESWDVTGLTLKTYDTTMTNNKLVINFLAVRDSGAVMERSVDMEGKDKSAPALARMWEERAMGFAMYLARYSLCPDEDHGQTWEDGSAGVVFEDHVGKENGRAAYGLRDKGVRDDEDACLYPLEQEVTAHVKGEDGFVSTEGLECETPEDEASFDGFMRDREYDTVEVKRRAANWSKSRDRRLKGTKFNVHELQEERVDDGAWLLYLSYRPRRLADDDRRKSIVVDDHNVKESHVSEGDTELLEVRLTNIRSTRCSSGSSCSTRHDDITPRTVLASDRPLATASVALADDAVVRTRRRSSASGGVASVQGTNTLLGAQLTPHRRVVLEEIPTGCRMKNGELVNVQGDNGAVEVDADFDVCVDVQVRGTAEHADGDIGADIDDRVLELRRTPRLQAMMYSPLLTRGWGWGRGSPPYCTTWPPLQRAAPNKDFHKHLFAMSPIWIDFE
ncbi:hypothetical protein CBR_g50351 [Chara braunii]|uniref:DUF659 domain-containing protein n=1 Tax=Chara braunii TaxID=69332 RepID=A0A388K5H3_CHABU|nr:hypothetical protein CBR_g50351 [Chara braunii]|eukprot:GBG65312.1 hypothetical protein CBR_g50351 [Chara braunii]